MLFKRSISINDNEISDIITQKKDGTFVNIATGREGEEIRDVVRDKRFLIIPEKNLAYHQGVYASYDGNASLRIAVVELVYRNGWKWKEKLCCVLKCRENSIKKTAGFGDWKIIANMPFYETPLFDVCGQTVLNDLGPHYKIETEMEPAGLKTALLGFFERAQSFTDNASISSNYFNMLHSLFALEEIISVPAVIRDMSAASNNICLAPVPEEAEKRIKAYAVSEAIGQIHRSYKKDFKASILQKSGEHLFLRVFTAVCIPYHTLEESEILLYESDCVLIREGMRADEVEEIPKTEPLLYADDLTGTVLEFTGHYITEWAVRAGRCLRGDYKEIKRKMADARMWYSGKYELSPNSAVATVLKLSLCRPLELICSMDKREESKIKQEILSMLSHRFSAANVMAYFFGPDVMPGTTITEILGIPKSFISICMENDWLGAIGFARTAFGYTKEAKGYLRNINEQEGKELYSFIKDARGITNIIPVQRLLGLMIMKYGCNNWKGYVKQISRVLHDKGLLMDYTEYILAVTTTVRTDAKIPWKLRVSDIKKKADAIKEAGILAKECDQKIADTQIALREDEFKALCYENDFYMIKYPKKAEDLLTEGFVLNHCVSSFVGPVAEGSTTVLFIREKAKPEQPFFTMEIRCGEIRQVHGASNRNIDAAVSLLTDFLKEFCEEKNIIFTKGEALFGI